MKCVFFCHAFSSCWNNGNAHFLRGVARELHKFGHEVVVYEPLNGWSRMNAIRDDGEQMLREALLLFPGISVRGYDDPLDLDEALDAADLVVVHEWNPPELIAQIGARRAQGAPFTLLFHDTHHRAVTARQDLARFDLDGFDGVLAFGEVLRRIYLDLGWADRAFTWHEGADIELYRPQPPAKPADDIVWIGNWGDGERSSELREFLIEPIARLKLRAGIYGVRYPEDALDEIEAAGIDYRGWLPAHRTPQAFARARATVHVPRAPYVRALPGIPTIRMFEAMACGVPIVSAPWDDCERLFTESSYLRVRNGHDMRLALATLLQDADFASATADEARRLVVGRHTCRHRVLELLDIVRQIRSSRQATSPAPYEGAPA
jgi:spore maturation protein CgeB